MAFYRKVPYGEKNIEKKWLKYRYNRDIIENEYGKKYILFFLLRNGLKTAYLCNTCKNVL